MRYKMVELQPRMKAGRSEKYRARGGVRRIVRHGARPVARQIGHARRLR